MPQTLYFTHANGFPGQTYTPMFQHLQAQGYHTDYIDKIAHNPHYPITHNWSYLVDELEQHITQRHTSPIVGVGHSAGALLNYQLAQRNPTIFSHLILMDPPVINGWQNSFWWLAKRLGFSDYFTPARHSKNRRTHFDDAQQIYQHLRHKTLFKHFTDASFQAYLQYGFEYDSHGKLTLSFSKEVELALYRTSADHLWRYRQTLDIPALYLTAQKSDFAKMPFAARFARRHNMTFKVLEGGHLFPMEHPQHTADVILTWLRKNPSIK